MLVVRLTSTVMNELKRARESERERERNGGAKRGGRKKITANKNARREKKKIGTIKYKKNGEQKGREKGLCG